MKRNRPFAFLLWLIDPGACAVMSEFSVFPYSISNLKPTKFPDTCNI